ncbi:hypothetical protein N7G274_010333 [Stereocaulon virgatum]|uniref:Uncharacterized protein n=1 Tax=Stereocaulon virgatum TaxID=373712 RepID=A0ABR4A0Q4_9LECA
MRTQKARCAYKLNDILSVLRPDLLHFLNNISIIDDGVITPTFHQQLCPPLFLVVPTSGEPRSFTIAAAGKTTDVVPPPNISFLPFYSFSALVDKPQASTPGIRRKETLRLCPRRADTSGRLRPQALRLIRTWPSAGIGIRRMSDLRTSGSLGTCMTADFLGSHVWNKEERTTLRRFGASSRSMVSWLIHFVCSSKAAEQINVETYVQTP